MKKTFILIALLGTVLLTGCNQQSSSDITNSTDVSSVNIQTTETETEVSTVKPTEKGTEAPTEDLSMYPTTLDNVDIKEVTSNLFNWGKDNLFNDEYGYSNASLCKEFLTYDKNDVKNNAFGIIVSVEYEGEINYYIVENNGQSDIYLPRSFVGNSVILNDNDLEWSESEHYVRGDYTKIITQSNGDSFGFSTVSIDFTSLDSVMNAYKNFRSQDFEVVFVDKIDL